MPPHVGPAAPANYPAACQALFSHLPPADRDRRADRVAGMIAAGEIDPAGLLAATVRGHVRGAILLQFHAGAAAVVSLPGGEAVDALAATAIARLRAEGVKQAQAVVPPEDVGRAEPLVRAGFRHVTQLAYFCRPVPGPALPTHTDSLAFTPVPEPCPSFADVLLSTYDGTLDCPELNGVRSAGEVLAGYAAKGDEPRWWLAARAGDPVGVVLLAAGPHAGVTELTYLGLVPAARGQRLGQPLLRHALEATERAGGEWLTLSVDVRNLPAIQLYRGHGFRQYDLQHVFLWTAG